MEEPGPRTGLYVGAVSFNSSFRLSDGAAITSGIASGRRCGERHQAAAGPEAGAVPASVSGRDGLDY